MQDQEVQFKLKKGVIIKSEKYDWTRKIYKMKSSEEEVHLRNIDETDERTYIFSIENTIRNLKSGIYKIIEEHGKN